jgi:UDP-2,3-diacylglucosamine hydrolase
MTAPSKGEEGRRPNEAAAPESISSSPRRIAIIAGSGEFPAAIAAEAARAGHEPFIVGLAGNASARIERFPHAYVHPGQVGRMLRILSANRCKEIVLIGGLRRPNLWRIKIDAGFLRHLPMLLRLMKGGDDSLLRGIARFFEKQGFEVIAAQSVAPRLLAPAGVISACSPGSSDLDDIRLGFMVTHSLGLYDIGQAAVVAGRYVLAVEAAEGTDAMLRRCQDLNRKGVNARRGVLVKRAKPSQDLRFDMPAIGPQTAVLAAEAGLAGIAVEAGAVLISDLEELVEKANKHGLFLYGVSQAELD